MSPAPDTTASPSTGADLLPSDLYGYESMLTPDEWSVVRRTREFLTDHVAPVAQDCWERGEFPHEIVKPMAEIGIMGLSYGGDGVAPASRLLTGFLGLEISRVDTSIATFYGVHNGLAMGSIHHCGSAEQQARWLPAMRRLELIGAFGLTEPEGGSDVAGGLRTTARRDGDDWILNGAKRWIGNATFADLTVIWARDEADDQVKGFVVEKGTPGFTATKIENKLALRTVQNADITLTDCRVPDANKLTGANSFRDTAAVLRQTRGGRGLGGRRVPDGRLRAGAGLRRRARAVRPPDRAVPAGPGSAGPHAGQHHGVTRPDGPGGTTAAGRRVP